MTQQQEGYAYRRVQIMGTRFDWTIGEDGVTGINIGGAVPGFVFLSITFESDAPDQHPLRFMLAPPLLLVECDPEPITVEVPAPPRSIPRSLYVPKGDAPNGRH